MKQDGLMSNKKMKCAISIMFRGKVYLLLARGTSTEPLVSIGTPDKWGYLPQPFAP